MTGGMQQALETQNYWKYRSTARRLVLLGFMVMGSGFLSAFNVVTSGSYQFAVTSDESHLSASAYSSSDDPAESQERDDNSAQRRRPRGNGDDDDNFSPDGHIDNNDDDDAVKGRGSMMMTGEKTLWQEKSPVKQRRRNDDDDDNVLEDAANEEGSEKGSGKNSAEEQWQQKQSTSTTAKNDDDDDKVGDEAAWHQARPFFDNHQNWKQQQKRQWPKEVQPPSEEALKQFQEKSLRMAQDFKAGSVRLGKQKTGFKRQQDDPRQFYKDVIRKRLANEPKRNHSINVIYRLAHSTVPKEIAPLDTAECLSVTTAPPPKEERLAVLLVAATRADYLRQVLDSLHRQSVQSFDVFLFVDKLGTASSTSNNTVGITNNTDNTDTTNKHSNKHSSFHKKVKRIRHGETVMERRMKQRRLGNAEVIQFLNAEYNAHNSSSSLVQAQRLKVNISKIVGRGTARMTQWAIHTAVNEFHYPRFMLLEDDHLIGHTYIEAIQAMLNAAQHMDQVAVVQGNFINVPPNGTYYKNRDKRINDFYQEREDKCSFQLSPMEHNIEHNAHDVWAWATTTPKWKKIEARLAQAHVDSGLDVDNYGKRDYEKIKQVMRDLCPHHYQNYRWAGQDWLRVCAFNAYNMTWKLQPTERLMSYIGKDGMQMNAGAFEKSGFDPVSAEAVTRNVSTFAQDLCTQTCLSTRIAVPSSQKKPPAQLQPATGLYRQKILALQKEKRQLGRDDAQMRAARQRQGKRMQRSRYEREADGGAFPFD